MSRFGLFSSSFKHSSLEFLLNPLFLRWLSVCLHLLLFFGVFGSWVRRKIRNGALEHPSKKARILYYRTVRLCCVVLALYNLCLCCFDYFFWYRNGRSDEKFVTLLDLLIRSSVFLSLFIYLLTQLPNSGLLRFPILLRIWWGFYFSFSCYSLILDLVDYSHNQALPAQLLVSDFVYVISGFILCYAGLFGEVVDENISLEEPLLNGNASDSVDSSNNSKGDESATPYGSAGFLSILTFSWMVPLISTGYKKVLDLEDVPQLVGRDSVNESLLIFKSSFDSVSGGSVDKLTTLQLVKSLIYTTWGDIVATAIFALLYTFASYVGPALIDSLVQYLNGRRQYKNEGYVLVSAFVVAKLVECLAKRHWFFRLQRAGIRARSVLVAMIYKKGLTLSNHSKQGHTSGEIINIMAVDAERIFMFSWYMHDPWLVLVQVMLALLVLYNNLGLASIAALVATVLVMLINYPLSSFLEKFQDKLMKSKDKRMKATSEILKNMRILKLQGWEMKFLSKISQLRQSEAGWLKKFLYTNAMTSFIFWGSPTFVSVVTFVACMFMGIPLEAGKILSALATFRILQEPIYNLPDTVSMVIQTKVSLDRIASFLRLEDLKPDVVERLPRASSEAGVEIIGGNFSWDSSTDPTLKDINVRVCHGMKVAVCGTVGSGKSSLLSCILGEMPKVSGILRVSGLKAYVSQSAWIQSGKIVDNILFGKEMDRERYESVLEACSLNKDLEILSFGDQTVIGERGINLSGGQKQRIQIARALYQDADIYLFDDPFSAVDAHTGTHLFKECLLGHLNSKTVIYVTHQVEFLPAADLILVMKDGRISQAGKYDDILATGSDFMELVGAHEKALSALDSDETEKSSLPMVVKENADDVQALQDPSNDDSSTARPDAIAEPKAQIVQEEEREKGKVGFPVYWKYITTAHGGALMGGGCTPLPFCAVDSVIILTANQSCEALSTLFHNLPFHFPLSIYCPLHRMAEEYNPHHHHNEEPVDSSDRGLFDFMKKKEEADKPVQEEFFVSEFADKVQVSEHEEEEEKHDHGSTLREKLHRSDSSSSSSSDEEGDDEEKKKKRKEKKSLKDKLKEKLHKEEVKHEEKVEVDTEVPVEKIHVEEVVYSESSQPAEEKKGFLDKIKEKLPGQHKKPEDVAAPPPPAAPVAAECGTPENEKKGFMEKIKEKIPGFHHKAEEEEKKEREKD